MVFVKFCAVVEGIYRMNKIILFGPYPPPYGGVSIYVSTLHEFLKRFGFNCELKIYRQTHGSYSDDVQPTFMSIYKNFSKVKSGDTCIDSSSFFLEYPSCGSTFAWLLIKLLKRFRWLKIIHDGSLPFRHDAFGFVQKLLFKLSIIFIDEFIVVS
jgi:glycosyltransferase involved in cell wall biosynthesis